jgi:hypothetical protein
MLNNIKETALVGDIKISQPTSSENYEIILVELEQFMLKHKIDKIDVGWSRLKLNQFIDKIQ